MFTLKYRYPLVWKTLSVTLSTAMLLFFGGVTLLPITASAFSFTFPDSFESGFSGWATAEGQWTASGGFPNTGTQKASVQGDTGGSDHLVKNISTEERSTIVVDYYYTMLFGLESGDSVVLEWFDGVNWVTAHTLNEGTPVSENYVPSGFINLPASAEDLPSFAIRFRANLSDASDVVYIDDVTVTMKWAENYDEACSDGDDNDEDGLTDFLDPGCAQFAPKLLVNKVVVGGDATPADFSITVAKTSAGTPFTQTFPGDGTGTLVLPNTIGTFNVSEAVNSSYSVAFSGACDPSGNVLLWLSSDVTCTVTNTFIGGDPVDVCPNIGGNQPYVPPGYHMEGENCVEDTFPPYDVCPNLDDIQTYVPDGMFVNEEGDCVDENGDEDVCENLDGLQTELPEGYVIDDETGDCVDEGGSCELSSTTYTLDGQFDQGTLLNIVHTPSDQLQLDDAVEPFGFIWVANSGEGTIVKIDTDTGEIKGEYRTSPDSTYGNPSRTTVDKDGSVWVGNRQAVANGNEDAAITHVGLVENGQCEDRNNNGTIETSSGLNDVKAWTDASGTRGVATAADECIVHFTPTVGSDARHISVNADNDVWVSGVNNRIFELVKGGRYDTPNSGNVIRTEGPMSGFGGYGGLIDSDGVIWSARSLMRWDTANPLTGPSGGNWTGYDSHDSYGLCIDPNTGDVWNTQLFGNRIHKYSPDGTHLDDFSHGYDTAQGCAVDQNGHVWVAHSILSSGQTVGHLLPNGTYVGNITVGSGPTGISIDENGKVWVTNYYSQTVMRIDPTGGPVGADAVTPVGAVDYTSPDLGGQLYNYSDMTGSTLTGQAESGTWTIVEDGGVAGAQWENVTWNSDVPEGAGLSVAVSSSEDGSTFGAPTIVTSGQDISSIDGRYLKVVVSMTRSDDGEDDGETPILYDLTINGGCGSPEVMMCSDGIDNDGDSLADMSDPGCSSPDDNDETNGGGGGGGGTPAACANGSDDDSDGFADYPADPGCESSIDTDETNSGGGGGPTPPPPPPPPGGGGGGGEVLGVATTEPTLPAQCSEYITTYMKMGKKNDVEEVKKLQTFLNKVMAAGLPVTGYFGQLTHNWVKKFQVQYHKEIIQPWVNAGWGGAAIANGTGYVYKTTKRWINLMECQSLTIPVPTDLQPGNE